MVKATIVGTGDMAYGLAHLFRNNNSRVSGNTLEVTKPDINHNKPTFFHDTGVPVVKLDHGLADADIVILAIPASALKEFISRYLHVLRYKVLVDVTNSIHPNEDLRTVLQKSVESDNDIQWVKAFNDVGAAELLLNKPSFKNKIQSNMCSCDRYALEIVKVFAEESMGINAKIVPYEQYNEICTEQSTIGEQWIHATVIMMLIFFWCEFYALLRYVIHMEYEWYHIVIKVTNKAICWTAIVGFALSQTPTVLAAIFHEFQNDTLVDKPSWLVSILGIRKHLSILSLWFLFVHILMSLVLLNPENYGKFYSSSAHEIDSSYHSAKMNAIGEMSLFFAIIGTALYVIMGIGYLPSVGSAMTNMQWQFLYGPVAWLALTCGVVHVIIMGVQEWTTSYNWPGYLPPITLISVMIPLFVMSLKLFQLFVTFCNQQRGQRDGSGSDYLQLPSFFTKHLSGSGKQKHTIKYVKVSSGTNQGKMAHLPPTPAVVHHHHQQQHDNRDTSNKNNENTTYSRGSGLHDDEDCELGQRPTRTYHHNHNTSFDSNFEEDENDDNDNNTMDMMEMSIIHEGEENDDSNCSNGNIDNNSEISSSSSSSSSASSTSSSRSLTDDDNNNNLAVSQTTIVDDHTTTSTSSQHNWQLQLQRSKTFDNGDNKSANNVTIVPVPDTESAIVVAASTAVVETKQYSNYSIVTAAAAAAGITTTSPSTIYPNNNSTGNNSFESSDSDHMVTLNNVPMCYFDVATTNTTSTNDVSPNE